MILSYYGDSLDVEVLMRKLSKNSGNYTKKNKLKGFVKESTFKKREISVKLNIFHRSNKGETFCYPCDETMQRMQRYEHRSKTRIQFKSVLYAQEYEHTGQT